MSEPGRKRCRDPLGDRAGENRFKEISQIKSYYLGGSRSPRVPMPTETHERAEKVRKAVALSLSWSICYSSENLLRLCKFFEFGDACNSGVF